MVLMASMASFGNCEASFEMTFEVAQYITKNVFGDEELLGRQGASQKSGGCAPRGEIPRY
jgi:hypothetical protein